MTAGQLASDGRPSRPLFRPLIVPAEHGGWGLVLEPILLGLAVAPSAAGSLVGLGFLLGFLARQPLKLALQDALRGRSYPRTAWCRLFSASLCAPALIAIAAAAAIAGPELLFPLAVAAPLAAVQIVSDARGRNRSLPAELCGAVAMTSSAATIVFAGGLDPAIAAVASAIIIARSVSTIIYVRLLLQRAHGTVAAAWPVLLVHAAAIAAVALLSRPLALLAMMLLAIRALLGITRPVPAARTIGWMEVGWGAMTVALGALSF